MIRFAVVSLLVVVGCVAPPAAAPVPVAPCPVVEPQPCDAITPEQRQILDAVAEILSTPLAEQIAGLHALVEERASAVADVERLRTDLDTCRRSNTELQARVEQLEADLEELKRLSIEMEMKATK